MYEKSRKMSKKSNEKSQINVSEKVEKVEEKKVKS